MALYSLAVVVLAAAAAAAACIDTRLKSSQVSSTRTVERIKSCKLCTYNPIPTAYIHCECTRFYLLPFSILYSLFSVCYFLCMRA